MGKQSTFSEKDRKYRNKIKEDPVRYAEYLKRERERYQRKKEKKQVKLIKDLTTREKRQKRKQWRIAQRRHRNKVGEDGPTNSNLITPPTSPVDDPGPGPSGGNNNVFNFDRPSRGRKRVRRDRSASYRKIQKLESELEGKTRLLERYKKRYYRTLSRQQQNSTPAPETPRSKTARLLGGRPVSSKVKKTLIFHYCLSSELQKKLQKRRESKSIVQIFKSKIMGSYKMKSLVKETFGIKKGNRSNKRIMKRHCLQQLQNSIKEFLERDDSSRLSAGKKSTITKNKIKKQRRYLVDTLKNLHLKFLSESNFVCSYSLFCRFRPFWVLKPDLSQRDTCICQIHDNLAFKATALKHARAIHTSDIDELISKICCDVENKACMYRECNRCKLFAIKTDIDEEGQQKFITWSKWSKISEKRQKRNADGSMKDYTAVFTAKVTDESSMWELLEDFNKDLQRACKHVFNIKHQYSQIRNLKSNLGADNCLIHMDFSENYGCKYHAQVQSAHFGASHHQASLHTCVLYTASSTVPICTISGSPRKDPAAIWSHLSPVFDIIKSDFPEVKIVNFLSDGPSGQYKNKTNMAMFSKKIYDYGFIGGTWNFLETSHGKGAPDGIGAVVKRTADRLIAEKHDIPDSRTMYQVLKDKTTVKLFYIDPESIPDESSTFSHVSPVKGTMALHQIISQSPGIISIRDVSCFCQGLMCSCFQPRIITILPDHQHTEKPITQDVTNPPETSNGLKSTSVEIDETLINKWCLVNYYGYLYPGIINDVDDEEIEVTAMSSAGRNRYFWPRMEDRIWYSLDKFLALIPEPQPITGRHFQVDHEIFEKIAPKFEKFTK
ncbi:hypothetical protein SNE40_020096 [Patella caerulea]|uniref:Uncharacterized protein n=1 Tax=Patella caerulea TaxID=87958 RepID=A0AAN8G6W0_PATCE